VKNLNKTNPNPLRLLSSLTILKIYFSEKFFQKNAFLFSLGEFITLVLLKKMNFCFLY